MKVGEFTKQQGNFLKASELKADTEAVIVGEAKLVHNERYDTDRVHIPIEVKEIAFIFDCSKTNARTITEALGEETNDWIGKKLVLEKYKTKTSDGNLVDAINVKEIK